METKAMAAFPPGIVAALGDRADQERRSRSELLREASRVYTPMCCGQ